VLGVLQGATPSYVLFPVLLGAFFLVLLAAGYHHLTGLGQRSPVQWL